MMIGFGIMMWFISVILIFLSISLLKGNDSWVHGKVLENTEDREGYVKELGKPVLLVGIGIFISGIIAVMVKVFSILLAVIFLLFIALIAGIWLYKIQKRFS